MGLEGVADKFRFSIAGTSITTVSEKPIKRLKKFFNSSLRDTASIKNTCEELEGWLNDVDKSGNSKTWDYNYEFLIITISDLEWGVSRYLRRWLGLLRSLNNIALYVNTFKLTLPLKSIEEFKVLRAREVLQLSQRTPKSPGQG